MLYSVRAHRAYEHIVHMGAVCQVRRAWLTHADGGNLPLTDILPGPSKPSSPRTLSLFYIENTSVHRKVCRRMVIDGPSKPSSSLVRFLPVSQYLLKPASGIWIRSKCGVLTSHEA